MTVPAAIGVDIGTSSSKGVLVGLDGRMIRSATREHAVDRPRPGWVEMDGEVWWQEFVDLSRQLFAPSDVDVVAVGVSGMGPCVLMTDEAGTPLRPVILYGIDARSTPQIARLNDQLGPEEILRRCGSALSTQAAGAKVAWVADNEPQTFARARRLFMPSSWLVLKLTGEYVLDQHSASQCTPLYDTEKREWYQPWVDLVASGLSLPPLRWPGEVAGVTTREAAALTGLPVDIPVITGTIDAWAEAISVGAQGVGDLMLMYGTTMFLINTVSDLVTSPSLWVTVGALPDTRNLAGGMATSGAITSWLRELFGSLDYAEVINLGERSGPEANGLLMLPYFAGERTPVMDPEACGVIAGLTLSHTHGDLYRAALEAIGLGVRHNIETIEEAGGDIRRIVAVGGGTQGTLWTQIVSDITARPQEIPSQTIGASYGGHSWQHKRSPSSQSRPGTRSRKPANHARSSPKGTTSSTRPTSISTPPRAPSHTLSQPDRNADDLHRQTTRRKPLRKAPTDDQLLHARPHRTRQDPGQNRIYGGKRRPAFECERDLLASPAEARVRSDRRRHLTRLAGAAWS